MILLLFHLTDIIGKQQTANVWSTQSDEFQPVKIIIIKMKTLSITSKSLLLPFCNPPIFCSSPVLLSSPGNHWSAFCHYRSAAFSRMLYTWNYTLCIFFVWLLSFIVMILQFIHVASYINSSLLFKHWTVFLCIDALQFVYPFTC